MADNLGVMDAPAVRAEDLLPVRSRITWGPILAGAALALALYLLLALLGGALGLSISGQVRGENLATGAAVWAILTTVLCLFVGGFITSQFSVGENKLEAMVYGLVMWAVVFGALMWLTATGVRASFHAMVGVATAGASVREEDWQEAARRAGISQDQIDQLRQRAQDAPGDARRAAEDPRNQQAASEAATRTAWWAFGGTLLSMIAAAVGALVGAGPTLRLVPMGRTVTHHSANRL